MKIELTQRAQIAFDHLPQPERKRVDKLVILLENFPLSPGLKGKWHKLKSPSAPDIYIASAGLNYRILFRHTGSTITILEIVDHKRLASFFRSLHGGGQ